jgi:hypothetical protein
MTILPKPVIILENNSSPTEMLGAMIRVVDLQTFPANINHKAGAVAINRLHHPPARTPVQPGILATIPVHNAHVFSQAAGSSVR